jgi:dolichol-phosphate mannosyltransferase
MMTLASRTVAGLQRRLPGLTGELGRFCLVGASGYIVNLAVYALLLEAGTHYLPAAIGSFAVAVANNYSWNRFWTFRSAAVGASVAGQGARFLVVSLASLGANLAVLHALVGVGADRLIAQAAAIVLVTPLNFLGSKLWAFARRQPAVASA